jgi:leucyl-tRNA synthetase
MPTHAPYPFSAIEPKWQKIWAEADCFRAAQPGEPGSEKPKKYILDMFPYPSGAGLHVGHLEGYTATDILCRYRRMLGDNVLHPMGWDAFGLPAEQHAVQTGTHPRVTTAKNISNFRRQIKAMGFSYDWSREIDTTDPKYFRWTQWIFLKLYEKGLAYVAEAPVWYCPALGTVLANEEILNTPEGPRSERGSHPVERRPMRQWMLKITAYAERLLQDLDLLEWPDSLKEMQRNWIGKSEGAKLSFVEEESKEAIVCFTTRPDTLLGVTFLVIAPEHPFVKRVSSKEVEGYVKEAMSKNDLARTDLSKEKTGVFSGAYAINPANGKKIPIWIADYVLMTYGTGAVMGVPGHDERDQAFAEKYGLEVIHLEEFITPDFEKGGYGERFVTYKLRDWLFSRQRYWGEPIPILHFEDGTKRILDLDELPLVPPLLEEYKPSPDGQSPLKRAKEWITLTDPKTGKKALRETNIMPQWAGSCWYYLRFCDPLNQKEAWDSAVEKYWMPVDLYVGGVEHAVLHLLYARFWHKVLYDIGLVSTKEPFQKLRNQGLITAHSYKKKGGGYVCPEEVEERDGKWFDEKSGEEVSQLLEKMSKSKLNGVSPEEMINTYGADALRVYELFMSPFDKEKIWNTKAVVGSSRFLNRVYDLVQSEKICEEESEEALKLGHRLLFEVTSAIEAMSFNTAIAKMMEFLNVFTELAHYPKSVVKMLIQLIYPFAPHLGEECWEMIGERGSLAHVPLPEVEKKYLVEDQVTIIFQVMGKLRGQAELPKGVSQEEAVAFAKADPRVAKHLTGEIVKEIFVPDRLLNFVIR